jgi:hypothetical protein
MHPVNVGRYGQRKYSSARDYEVILGAVRAAGGTSLRPVMEALLAAGVEWPVLCPSSGRASDCTPDAVEVDRDILRAWRETGIHPKN